MSPAVEAQSLNTGSPGKSQLPPFIVCAFLYLSYPAVRNVLWFLFLFFSNIFSQREKKMHAEREKPLKPGQEGGRVRRSQGLRSPGESWTLTRAAEEEPAAGRVDGGQRSRRHEPFHCLSRRVEKKQIEQKPRVKVKTREGTSDNRWERQAEPLPPFPEQMAPLWATFGCLSQNFPSPVFILLSELCEPL